MTITRNTAAFMPRQQSARAVSRRGFLKNGLGLLGVAGAAGTGTAAFGAAEAAFDLRVTEYSPRLAHWPAGQKLSICVIADIHAGGPNMGIDRVRQIVDTSNAPRLRPDRPARRLLRASHVRHACCAA